jgi:hypothetical protein
MAEACHARDPSASKTRKCHAEFRDLDVTYACAAVKTDIFRLESALIGCKLNKTRAIHARAVQMANTSSTPSQQQGGSNTPSQQVGQSSGPTQQQGGTTKKPIIRDWAAF